MSPIAPPNALGRKGSDEWAVPLCAIHHRSLHDNGNERVWWKGFNIDPIKVAEELWEFRWRSQNGFSHAKLKESQQ